MAPPHASSLNGILRSLIATSGFQRGFAFPDCRLMASLLVAAKIQPASFLLMDRVVLLERQMA